MRDVSQAEVAQTVETLFQLGRVGDWTDADLLDRFVSREDESRSAAFEVLVDRHGPMVLDVCRNVLRDAHEAEDAFQATFMILARQGRSIHERSSVGSWLFGVATRVALRARADAARRRARERIFAQDVAARGPSTSDEDAKAALHQEIARLPERYREPIVLCYLEGLSYQAAAKRLGCPIGTVSVRLMRARERLRVRLVRQGETVSAATGTDALAVDSDRPQIAPVLVASTVKHAAGLVAAGRPAAGVLPCSVDNLLKEVSVAMFIRQFAVRLGGCLVVGCLLVGSGVLGYQAVGNGSQPATIVAQQVGAGSVPPKTAPDDRVQTTANRLQSTNNLRQLGLAIMAFEQANGFLPPAAIRDANTGQPLLSWRVAVLPWIGSEELYQQFHLNEAWDSPHNKTLLAKMPVVYAPLGVKTDDPFATFYQVFAGPGTAFEPLPNNGKLRITSIRDGAANTLAVVEAGEAVPWSKPEDLRFLPGKPLPPLGGQFKDGFKVTFLDASLYTVDRRVDERLLKGLITRAGGEPVNRDQLPQIPLEQQPVREPAPQPAQVRNAQVKKVAEPPVMSKAALAQLELARRAFEVLDAMQSQAKPLSVEVHHKWALRLLEAERAVGTTKPEQIAALEKYCTRMKQLKERALTLYQAAQLDWLQYMDTEYWHNEAVAWLQKAKE